MTDLVARYAPFVLGAIAAAVFAAYTMRSTGRYRMGRTLGLFFAALAIFIAADLLTGQALTRPESGWVGAIALAVLGLAVVVALSVLVRRTRT